MKTRCAILFAALLSAAPAQAHKLKVFAVTEGARIVGTAYFSGGGKAMNVPGQVQAPDGMVVERIMTGGDGEFHVEARSRMDHTIMLETGDGHTASMVVSADDLPSWLPQGASPAKPEAAMAVKAAPRDLDAVEQAVARQIAPLRRQLDAYEDKIRLHDLLGGIGVIFGVFGTVAWLNARKERS